MAESYRVPLSPAQRIRCEALACAVRTMASVAGPTAGTRAYKQETLQLAERFERWIRGEGEEGKP